MQQQNLYAEVDQLARLLMAKHHRVVTAESCTGGGIAAALTDVAGSSAWFEGGFVTYSNAAKSQFIGVNEDIIESQGAVSEATVRAMVQGAIKHSSATLAVAVSGIAGPGGATPDKPVGTVWFAWGNAEQQHCECCLFDGDRASVRAQAVEHAIRGLIQYADRAAV